MKAVKDSRFLSLYLKALPSLKILSHKSKGPLAIQIKIFHKWACPQHYITREYNTLLSRATQKSLAPFVLGRCYKRMQKELLLKKMAPPSRMIESLKQIQSHINTNKHLRSHTWHEALLKFSQTQQFLNLWFSTEIHLPKTHQQANDTIETNVKSISHSSSPTNHECTFANFSKGMKLNILLSNSIKHLRDQLLMPHVYA